MLHIHVTFHIIYYVLRIAHYVLCITYFVFRIAYTLNKCVPVAAAIYLACNLEDQKKTQVKHASMFVFVCICVYMLHYVVSAPPCCST